MNKKSLDDAYDEEFDFGFTSMAESEIKQYEEKLRVALRDQNNLLSDVKATADIYEDKLNKMYKLIQPLLKNLSKDDGKDYIFWPDRKKKIEAFKQKLDDLMK